MPLVLAAQRAVAALGPAPSAATAARRPPPPPPTAWPPGQRVAQRRRQQRAELPVLVAAASDAAAAGVPDPGGDSRAQSAPQAAAKPHANGLMRQLQPLSNATANKKLLALSIVEASFYASQQLHDQYLPLSQMFSSIATLMHDTYLPLYMSEVLGMSSTKMGNLHAILQFSTRASGIVSGRLSDILSPARMVIIGTLLTAAVCKPMFAACGLVRRSLGVDATVSWVKSAKVLDRTVKGLRETPAKALVGELAAISGDSAAAAFSVRQALSTLGMLLGSAAAGLAYSRSGGSYEVTFGLSTLIAALSLLLVAAAFGRDAKEGAAARRAEATASSMDESFVQLSLLGKARALLGALKPAYWQAVLVVMLLYQARFDVAFIVVHASSVMDRAKLPTLNIFSMLPVVLLATPMGLKAKSSVRARNTVLLAGFAVLIAGNLAFSFMPSFTGMALGSTCVGVHMAMTQGVLFGMIASVVPTQPVPGLGRISGTVWSLTDLLMGVALAGSNTLAGRLSDWTLQRGMGATGCFLGACAATVASGLALLLFMTWGDLGREQKAQEAAAT